MLIRGAFRDSQTGPSEQKQPQPSLLKSCLQLEALASVSRIHNQVMLPGKSASSSQ